MGSRTGAVSMRLCGEVRQSLGVYVLGAIEPADRDVADLHLAECADCRRELTGLAGLPGLLRRVSVEEASALAAEDLTIGRGEDLLTGPVLRSLQARAGRHRRLRSRIQVAAAAAAGLVAGAGVIAGWQAAQPPAPRPAVSAPAWTATFRAADWQTRAGVTVRYAARH